VPTSKVRGNGFNVLDKTPTEFDMQFIDIDDFEDDRDPFI